MSEPYVVGNIVLGPAERKLLDRPANIIPVDMDKIQREAFLRGARAMREAAAEAIEAYDSPGRTTVLFTADGERILSRAEFIRGLPDPS